MAWNLKANGTTDYVEGNLAASLTGDFTLKYVGVIDAIKTSGSAFGNLLSIVDTGGSGDYLGIALNSASPWDKLKIISNGATPGNGTTVIVAGQEYTLELRYIQSTNLASMYIDNVFEYSVSPTSGATWIPTCDAWRLFSATTLTSFGEATVYDGTQIIDEDTPANTIKPTPTLSGGSGLVLPDASANAEDGTLAGFSGDEWVLSERAVTDSAIPNITTKTVQGFCRDASYYYMFDTTYTGGFTNRIKKVTLAGAIDSENTSPYSSLGAGAWKLNDGCVSGGVIYNPVQDTVGGTKTVTRYSASTLAYISHTDITAMGAYNAGCCIGHTGNLFFVGNSSTSGDDRTTNVTEITTAGVFVATHTLDAEVFGMQGITWDGVRYLVTSHDTTNSLESIFVINEDFELQERLIPSTPISESEGIEFYSGEYYYNDIGDAPLEFTPEFPSPITITESLTALTIDSFNPSIDFTGVVSVTESLTNLNLNSFNPTIGLTATLTVTESLTNLEFNSLGPIVTLTPPNTIIVTEATTSLTIDSFDPTITFSGTISVTEILTNLDFRTYRPTVQVGAKKYTNIFYGTSVSSTFSGTIKQAPDFSGIITTSTFSGVSK